MVCASGFIKFLLAGVNFTFSVSTLIRYIINHKNMAYFNGVLGGEIIISTDYIW